MASDLQAKYSPLHPSFFIILLQETLRNNKLPIPKKSVRKFGGTLKSQVLLKLPCGSQWKLGVTKSSDGKMWIHKGWAEFSKHYSLAFGHLLVFRYEGNSQFHVSIFDTTTTEIDYPNSNLNHFDKSKPNDFFKEETIDIEEYSLPCKSRPHKRMRTSASCQSHQSHPWPSRKVTLITSSTSMAINKAIEAASKFFSTKPYFPIVLQRSYLERGPLNIPSAFAKSYLKQNDQSVTLKVGERCWHVSLLVQLHRIKCSLSRGWVAFARENALAIGDVCIFELIKRIDNEVVMEVTIFRQAR